MNKFNLISFNCDEGVRRNNGRVGAAQGAAAIKASLKKLLNKSSLNEDGICDFAEINFDADLTVDPLLACQQKLAAKVEETLKHKIMPLVLGGGHEVAYGHFMGIHNYLKNNLNANPKIGIINFDAHFDLRPLIDDKFGSSGTPFLQISNLLEKSNFHYMVLGIQEKSNMELLFQAAKKLDVEYHLIDKLNAELEEISSAIDKFIESHDYIYLTVCLDVFDKQFAPGVSAPATNGLMPEIFSTYFKKILKSNKLISFDIAEMNPKYDIDSKTADLAATLLRALLHC